MSFRTSQTRKPILTLEAMFLMSASGIDVDLNAEIDPSVGSLPGLDFPGDWIIEAARIDQSADIFAPLSEAEERIMIDALSPSPANEAATSFPIAADTNASLAFLSEGAGFRNTIGTYLIDPSTGQISDIQIAFANASAEGSGGDLVRGDAVGLNIENGKQVGFFILANGYGQNDIDSFANSELTFAPGRSGGTTLIATNPGESPVTLNGELYVSDPSMNPDGLDHFQFETTESGLLIQIEDLPDLGDQDFDDVVLELSFVEAEVVVPEFASRSGSAVYVEGTAPVVLDANAALNEVPDGSFDGATITLQRSNGPSDNDTFAASGTLSELSSGSNVVVNESTIGQVVTNDNGTITLSLNENATTDLVNSALRQLTYSNSSDYISGDIDIAWTLTTSDGSASTQSSTNVRLIDSDRIYVTTSEREVDGDTSSIAALIANNGGTGISLEEAIIAANNTQNVDGADEIFFNIAGDGVHVIAGIGQPDITEAVTIDAATESDFVDSPRVVLDGNDAAGNAFTLTSSADGSEIRGFNIRDFGGNGIVIQAGSDNNIIANNWIGSLANDGSDAGADEQIRGAGIVISGAQNYIGGISTSEANVISGNDRQGILITGDSADDNVIHGNLIGTDRDGTIDLGNRLAGIRIDSGADGTIIGGIEDGAGNILSGNDTFGVRVAGQGTDGTVIQGNLIGTDQSGAQAIGNEINGIRVDFGAKSTTIGGSEDGAGNVVSGNAQQGIRVSGEGTDDTVIQGNVVGTNSDGSIALGNGFAGVRIDSGAQDTVVGGDSTGAGNILSGNGAHGVRVHGAGTNDTTIQGNLIGTDQSGTEAIGNEGVGILVDGSAQGTTIGGSSELAGNVVSANALQGVRVSGDGTDDTVIQGNVIGTNNDGTSALGNKYAGILIDAGAADSVVGGDSAEAANILSGNGTFGVRVTGEDTNDTTIQGNLIGTDESGSAAIGNADNGVRIDSGAAGTTVGGTSEGAGNVISGNGTQGVRITGEGTDFSAILGNVIGTDSNGLLELGNRFAGVLIDAGAQSSVIGGSQAGSANIVSGNGTDGIRITGQGTNDHTVLGNLIGTDHTALAAVGNASSGIRIDSGAQQNTVGGASTDVANVISANGADGIQIDGSGTDNNVVKNNDVETLQTDPALANAGQAIFVGAATNNNTVNVHEECIEPIVANELVALADFLDSQSFDLTNESFKVEGISSLADGLDSSDPTSVLASANAVPEFAGSSAALLNQLGLTAAPLNSGSMSNEGLSGESAGPENAEPGTDAAANPMLIVQDANVDVQQARSATSNKARSEAEEREARQNSDNA
ncbi:MAG: DUF4114 domain-containing protein [Fuerstiella sp.]